MSLPIALITTDFDGTLYSEFEYPHVPARLQETITRLQAQGVKWMINTGRDLSGLMETMARGRLSLKPDFIGAVEREIFVHNGHSYVPSKLWNDTCTQAHKELFGRIKKDIADMTAWVNDRFDATVYQDIYSPFCLTAGNNDDADQIMVYLEEFCRKIPNLTIVRNDVYARLAHAHYNKGSVMSEIARQLQIPPGQMLAAGDHFNDLPMLDAKRARWLVAPDNAIRAVKELIQKQNGYLSPHACGYGVMDGLNRCLESATQPS